MPFKKGNSIKNDPGMLIKDLNHIIDTGNALSARSHNAKT